MNIVPGGFSHVEPEIRGVKWACGDVIELRVHTLYTLQVTDAHSQTRRLRLDVSRAAHLRDASIALYNQTF